MAGEKPTAAFVLSLIGAIFILLNGLILVALASMLAGLGGLVGMDLTGLGIAIAALGMVFGIVVLLGAIMLWARPAGHKAWGIVVLVFSILSIFIGGGFFIGLILGLVGGILGIVWKPPMAPMAPPMQPQWQQPPQ